MITLIALLTLGLVGVTAGPTPQRIVGGSVTTINNYPSIVALLRTTDWSTWRQACGGSIVTNRHIVTAAQCPANDAVGVWRVRVGSTWANSGGVVHNVNEHRRHPNFNSRTLDNDVAILRLVSTITFNNNARPGTIARTEHVVGDNQLLWAAGWGLTQYRGSPSEQLRHVQVRKINFNTCRSRYFNVGQISLNMICSGLLDVGGRGTCQGDTGGPLYHNDVIVGITSWSVRCGDPAFPSVSVRVSRFFAWIRNNSVL